jgi:hypothetical protein
MSRLELDPLQMIDRLRSFGDPVTNELAAVIEKRLAGKIASVDRELGLEFEWRDEELRRVAALHFAKLSSRKQQARAIAVAWARYDRLAWPREQSLRECPKHRFGTPEAEFWNLQRRGFPPIGERRLFDVLSAIAVAPAKCSNGAAG